MESDRPGAEMNKQEWENAIEAGSFCWRAVASPCQPLWGAQISIRSASLCAWQRVYRGSFLNQASPTAGTAPDKKAHSGGDSSAHRPPLGNGWDGRMNAFVEGKSGARRSRRQTEREEINKGGGENDALRHTQTQTQSQAARHKLDRGSCGDLFDICSMRPIDICAMYLNALPFRQRGDGSFMLGVVMWLRTAAMDLVFDLEKKNAPWDSWPGYKERTITFTPTILCIFGFVVTAHESRGKRLNCEDCLRKYATAANHRLRFGVF